MHIIIFDEIDAICKQRGSMAGSTGVHDTVVNQLLSKIDGVEQLNNILVIGTMVLAFSCGVWLKTADVLLAAGQLNRHYWDGICLR